MYRRGFDGEELSQDRKKGSPENRREGQTLPLRQVSEAQPEARQDSRTLVLSKLPEPKRCSRIAAR